MQEPSLRARAEREVSTSIAELGVTVPVHSYDLLVALAATCWLGGYHAGGHAVMEMAGPLIEKIEAL